MIKVIFTLCSVMVIALSGTGWEGADIPDEIYFELRSPIKQANQQFGNAVDITDSGLAVVGVMYDRQNGLNSGTAYLLIKDEHNVWNIGQELELNPPSQPGDLFGYSVSMSGDWIAIGAPRAFEERGAVYFFKRRNPLDTVWHLEQGIRAPRRIPGDYFGSSLDMHGNSLIVGAFGDRQNGVLAGAVYFYKLLGNDKWKLEKKIVAKGVDNSDYFGISVAITDNYAIAGAMYDDDSGNDSGAAYIFTRDFLGEWFLFQKIAPPFGSDFEIFGYSVDIDGERAIIGSPGAPQLFVPLMRFSGRAYVFKLNARNKWRQEAILAERRNQMPFDAFGSSVSISGDWVIVGAREDDEFGINSGSAHLFHNIGHWAFHGVIGPDELEDGDSFGAKTGVKISPTNIIVGAPFDDRGIRFRNSGAVYIYSGQFD